MFISWYEQRGTFAAHQEVLDMYLMRERPLLERNADKLECVRALLLQVAHELGEPGGAEPAMSAGGWARYPRFLMFAAQRWG